MLGTVNYQRQRAQGRWSRRRTAHHPHKLVLAVVLAREIATFLEDPEASTQQRPLTTWFWLGWPSLVVVTWSRNGNDAGQAEC